MKRLLKSSSLIRVVVIMVVMAFMAGQVTDTYAGGYSKWGTSGGSHDSNDECCDEIDAIKDRLDELEAGDGGGTDPGECPAAVPKTGSTINVDTGEDGNLLKGVAWPEDRFTINQDGTITDNLTCLIWDVDADRPNGTRTWAQALNDCGTSSFGGHDDWRLPNVRELQSLIHYGVADPAVPNTAGTGQWSGNGDPFNNVQSANYWSSTTDASAATGAWVVLFDVGNVNGGIKGTSGFFVWCVRGGP